MKRYLISLFLLIIFINAQSEITKTVKTNIDSVTIFLDGAQILRSASLDLPKGMHQLVFTDLSPKLNPQSINITSLGDVSILSIVEKTNFMAKEIKTPRIQQLKDSLEILNEKKSVLEDEKNVYSEEKQLILKNREIGGNQNGVSILELEKAADFYRKRLMDINQRLHKLNKELNGIQETTNKINLQLRELNNHNNPPKSEITLTVEANSYTKASFIIRYVVSNAGWAPVYDLVAQSITEPITLKYRANAYNNTGVDWKDVKVKLSTADPMQSASKPILKKWVLNYNSSVNEGLLNEVGYYQKTLELNLMNTREVKQREDVEYQAIEIATLSAEFDIKKPYSIPSDAKPYILEITEYELPADFQHYSAPKEEHGAFLLAKVTGWEDLDLVEGTANVYFGNTYIGRSYIYTRNLEDTLDLSLGRDNKILVTRKKVKELSSKKFFSLQRKETYAYEIEVKNNRKEAITMEVQDQIPISEESEIKVEALELSDAELDEISGIASWKLKLSPGESKKMKISFFVKYPKNKRIRIYHSKVVYCPRF